MNALILAAGLGTRLRPYTHHTPKALFTINGQPILGITIEKLQQAGFKTIMVNTHHHHAQIESYVASQSFAIPVITCREIDILGTGGAIGNVAGHWRSGPLLVINGDVVTDIDLAKIYQFHQSHEFPVTMVMHDREAFNSVGVNQDDFITRFSWRGPAPISHRVMAFTGIHVIDRQVLDFLPPRGPAHIIETYNQMLKAGEHIKAHVVKNHYWQDIGAPERYQTSVFDHMAPLAFRAAFGTPPLRPIERRQLHGDGSDRLWYRLQDGPHSLIMVDHGIRTGRRQQEVDAYVRIGHHLDTKGIAVPKIYLNDNFAGLVFLEDLGDAHLQTIIRGSDEKQRLQLYHQVLDQWMAMAVEGGRDFDPSWTYQTARYDRDVILHECRYFVEAFVQRYLGWHLPHDDLSVEFEQLADQIRATEISGFLHRDFQSRNIMVQNGEPRLIDFQGGRIGPIQYDLASLLIDPNVSLPEAFQEQLRDYAGAELKKRYGLDPKQFIDGYKVCAVSRNLQILGAFSFLGLVKGKTQFMDYIPRAVRSLAFNLSRVAIALPKLTAVARKICAHTAQRPCGLDP